MRNPSGAPDPLKPGGTRFFGTLTMPFNSRPLVLLALLFALGIAIGRVWGPAWLYPLLFLCASAGAGIVLLAFKTSAWIPVFLAAFFLGAFLCSAAAYPDYYFVPGNDKVQIRGKVCELPAKEKTKTGEERTIVVLDNVSAMQGYDTIPLKGRVSVTVKSGSFTYGQKVAGKTSLYLPGDADGEKAYLLARRIWYTGYADSLEDLGNKEEWDLYGVILSARMAMEKTVNDLYGNATPVMKAMLLGDQDDIPDAGKDAFRTTGTAHILAVSGLNVGFMAAPLFFLLTRIIRTRTWIRFAITSAVLVLHCVLTGLSPPILRATIMAIFIMAGRSWGRKPDTPTALAASFILILALNPMWLYDIGFQLSYSGVAGILLVTPRVEQGLKRIPKALIAVLAASVGGQAGTLPFTAYHFNQISVLGLLVNIVAVPLTGIIFILGFISVLLGLIWLPLGIPFAFIAKGLLMAMLSAVAFGATVPGMTVKVETPGLGYFIWYFAFLVIISPYFLARRKIRSIAGWVTGGVCLTGTLVLILIPPARGFLEFVKTLSG